MVEVIKNNYKKTGICKYCKSILTYELSDAEDIDMGKNEWKKVIKCPLCGVKTEISI